MTWLEMHTCVGTEVLALSSDLEGLVLTSLAESQEVASWVWEGISGGVWESRKFFCLEHNKPTHPTDRFPMQSLTWCFS